jgi:hypothetical protein
MKNYSFSANPYGLILTALICIWLMSGCGGNFNLNKEYPQVIPLSVDNSAGPARTDELLTIDINSIKNKYPDFNAQAYRVLDGDLVFASQVDYLAVGGLSDQISFICNLASGQSKNITIRYNSQGTKTQNYKKRTQAELSHKVGGNWAGRKYEGGNFRNVEYLRVPPEHTDHSFFIRYEGPGWESDKVGYRFYLDWRNAVDIFGKKTTEMVLQNTGQDGFESYHQMSDWGMDILKVGDALGLGSVAMWVDNKAERVSVTDSITCAITANGPIQSQIRTDYYGWQPFGDDQKYNLVCWLTINAGSRMTHCKLQISGDPSNLCTGIVKSDSTVIIQNQGTTRAWQYLATYGRQSLANDRLGMAILYQKDEILETTADTLSQVLVLKPRNGSVDYYFLAAWEKEPGGIVTLEQFRQYLDQSLNLLDTPVKVTLN